MRLLTFGMPLTEQLRVALYPAITERFTKGCVNLGASVKSWFLWVGGLYSIPEEAGRKTVFFSCAYFFMTNFKISHITSTLTGHEIRIITALN